MNDLSKLAADHEPAVETIELLCDQLADLGLAVAPDTARDLIRTMLAAEAPRLDARWRGALGTSLDTIRIAAQAALGMLNTTAGPEPAPHAQAAAPAAVAAAAAAAPAVTPPARPAARTPPAPTPTPTPLPSSRRPIARRGPRSPSREEPLPPPPSPMDRRANTTDTDDPGEHRPVFKRPRGR